MGDPLIILALAIGFSIALVIAWAFELTPEGIKRTKAADELAPRRTNCGRTHEHGLCVCHETFAQLRCDEATSGCGFGSAPTKILTVASFHKAALFWGQ